MAGSMRQRSEGSWHLRAYLGRDPVTGRKRYVARTFHGTKREASKALAKLVSEAEKLTPRASKTDTMEVLLRQWFEHASTSWSPKTADVVGDALRSPILPALGSIPVSKLTVADLDRFYHHLLTVGGKRGPYKPATVRRVHGMLRRALAQGVRWGWIAHNPAIEASPPRVPMPELRPPSPGEVARLFRVAQASSPALACYVVLAASTGARRGELVALRWRDLDFEHATLSIERGHVVVKGQLIEQGTKTHQVRRVTLDPGTVAVLHEHRAMADANAAAAGVTITDDSYIFSRATDGRVPWRPDATTRDFGMLLQKAGVPGVRLHDLRHYVATQLLASGTDVRTVAGRLGHRNPATTLNVYSHFVPQADQQAAEALGAIFGEALKIADSSP
jgi:integrase